MLRHARLTDDGDVLEVGAGTGYGAAVLCERSGYRQVTTIEADEYLTKAAGERLAGIGLHPRVARGDPYGPLPGRFDRIASMVAVRPVPASWLAALHPGGRLVTPIAGTALILTADKTPDGGATGRTEWDRGAFMPAEIDADAPAIQPGLLATVREADGARRHHGPVSRGERGPRLGSVLRPRHHRAGHPARASPSPPTAWRTAWMVHADGSWARATGAGDDPPTVHQGGPPPASGTSSRASAWTGCATARCRVYGADATVTPDGTICLQHGHWQATLPASPNGPPPA